MILLSAYYGVLIVYCYYNMMLMYILSYPALREGIFSLFPTKDYNPNQAFYNPQLPTRANSNVFHKDCESCGHFDAPSST